MARKLLVVTNKREDGKALSETSRAIFDRVLEFAVSVCGEWDDVVLKGTDNPKLAIKKYKGYDVLLVGKEHAQLIKELSPLDLSTQVDYQLFGILVEKNGRRIIATPSISSYGYGEVVYPPNKTMPTVLKSSLLGHLYRHLELLAIGLIGYKNPSAPYTYTVISNMQEFDKFYEKLQMAKVVGIDSETKDLRRIGNTVLMLQFAFDGSHGWVLPIAHVETPFSGKEIKIILNKLKFYFERHKPAKHLFFNAVFDLHQLFDLLNLEWYNHKVLDLANSQFQLDENREARKTVWGYTPADTWGMARMVLEYGMDFYFKTKIGKSDRSRLESKKLIDVAEYGAVDAIVLFRMLKMQLALAAWRNERIPGRPYERFKVHLIEVEGTKLLQFLFMERRGLRVDVPYLLSLLGKNGLFLKEIRETEKRMLQIPEIKQANELLLSQKNVRKGSLFGSTRDANTVIDLNKPAHQVFLFFDVMKLKPISHGKRGKPSTGKAFKKHYASNPVIMAFADLAEAKQMNSHFVEAVYKLLKTKPDNKDDHLHTRFKSVEIKTGRSASIEPNLQNLPERAKKRAKIVKRQFIFDDDKLGVRRDYSAHEVRCWGIAAKDKAVANVFWTGMQTRLKFAALRKIADAKKEFWKKALEAADVHRLNYSTFHGVKPTEVTKIQRDGIKPVIFKTLYGAGYNAIGRDIVEPIPKRIAEIDKELEEINKQLENM